MNRNEIEKVFEENCVDKSDWLVYTISALEVSVYLKNGSHILTYCGEKEFVDCGSNTYMSVANTFIEPISEIEKIEVKWRR